MRIPMTLWPQANDGDNPWVDEGGGGGIVGPGLPGGGGGGGGWQPEPTRLWADIAWTYTEPEPQGACTGFEVAIFAGDSIDEAVAFAVPIEFIDDPSQRRWICPVELAFPVALRAAVRACYGAFKSRWANAAIAAQFEPLGV
jgi:hypothetical protein